MTKIKRELPENIWPGGDWEQPDAKKQRKR